MTKKKSVAFVCHPYHRGGVTRWMADAALAMSADNHKVYFVTVEPEKEFLSGKGRETLLQLLGRENNNITIFKTTVGHEFEFGTNEYRIHVYQQLIQKVPIGTPFILPDDEDACDAAVSFHGFYPLVSVLHADEEYYYKLAKKYSGKVDVFACVSERVNKKTRLIIPEFDVRYIYTIPCGINLPEIKFNSKENAVLKLVYVGRISDYQKRTGDLVKIAALLVQNKISFNLKIIGDGIEARPLLENKVKEAGLSEYVSFLGWLSQKQVGEYLSESDMLILTSDFEGTPIAMMEALASGCGMVGTRVSGIEDYEHHPLATSCLGVYEVGDIEDAVRKIGAIAAVKKETRMKAARTIAESEFTMQVCLQRYLKAIDTIAMRPAPEVMPNVNLPLKAFLYSRALALARYWKVTLTK